VSKSRRMRWEGNVVWEKKTAYPVLAGKSEGKIHLEELVVDGDQIKMDPHEKGWEDVDCTYLSPERKEWLALVRE